MSILLQDLAFRLATSSCLAFGIAALSAVVPTFPPSLAAVEASFGGQIDTKAAATAIMQADRDLNQSVASRDKKKFLSLISEAAVFVGDGPMRGHDEILKGWGTFFDPNGPTLTWEPTDAEVLVGGDVGVTIGSWVRRARTPDGKATEARGQYVTTWQKQKDGTWKVVYDIGSTAP